MKIAYITTETPYNKHSWSGTNYYVRKSLEDLGHTVYCIYGYKNYSIKNIIMKGISKILKKNYQSIRSYSASKGWAKFIKSKLEPNTDVILSLSTIPIAYLKTDIPIYIYIDGIFEYMLNQGFKKILNSYTIAHNIELHALLNCTKVITSSIESSNTISKYYNIDKNKIKVVPLGANFDYLPDESQIISNIENKQMDICKILFVGVDWHRKGANIVIDTIKYLYEKGFPIELHLVGLKNISVDLPSCVINHGFINKMDENGMKELVYLFMHSHFLFVPSIGEAYGLVFSEASAFGLPSISHSIGGISTIILNDINGKLFDVGTNIEQFADYIEKMFIDRNRYKELSIKTYKRFKNELSWKVSSEKIIDIIKSE